MSFSSGAGVNSSSAEVEVAAAAAAAAAAPGTCVKQRDGDAVFIDVDVTVSAAALAAAAVINPSSSLRCRVPLPRGKETAHLSVVPGRYCWPRHRMPLPPSTRVQMRWLTWRAIAGSPYLWAMTCDATAAASDLYPYPAGGSVVLRMTPAERRAFEDQRTFLRGNYEAGSLIKSYTWQECIKVLKGSEEAVKRL
jgi:hypothetical protein